MRFIKILSDVYHLLATFRSRHQRCSIKNAVLKNFAVFTGKDLYWNLILIRGLATLLKRGVFHTGVFPWILRNLLYSANIYLLKVSNRNTRKRCEIWPKLTIKTSEWRHWRRSGVFIVRFEHISCLFLVLLLLTLNK